ncbi:MAG: DUF523 domain-containing protein [Candidatus Methylomirabilales bacterium]
MDRDASIAAREAPIVVSACLAGLATTHDERARPHPKVLDLVRQGRAILVCPEQLGGLPTPRPPAEILAGSGEDVLEGRARVLNVDGVDATGNYLRGAKEALKVAGLAGSRRAILKARSPSCGKGRIYDGSFSGKLKEASGVTAAAFRRAGIEVLSEEELDE